MKGYKTLVFGLLIAALSVLSNAEMQVFVADNLPALGSLTGTVIIILRAVTTSPIFKKEKRDDAA